MEIVSTYSVKIKDYNHIFRDTVSVYRKAVGFFIDIALQEWEILSELAGQKLRVNAMEHLTHRTKKNPDPKYDFGRDFYKFPSYLRRAALAEALGKVSSYRSNLENWEKAEKNSRGKKPSVPVAGRIFPTLYRDNMYVRIDDNTAKIKVFHRNTWDFLTVQLKKSDVDYILRHCQDRTECTPTLRKRGKEWYLDFPFKEKVTLTETPVSEQIAVAVDLGLNHACTCCVMRADGTILGRHFQNLSREQDRLTHALNRIKKAQQNGARKTPRLWNRAKGINEDISVKTAHFIMDIAVKYHADVIVFEYLDLQGRKRGSRRQKLHMWKAQYVQSIVTNKAHRKGIRIRRVNAWNTSRLAFDGSGKVERGICLQEGKTRYNYGICVFSNGKTYNCDLNACYNIGARYFIREKLKSLPEMVRLGIEAKVPECTKRSTCTLSSFISLNVALAA